MDAIDVAPPAFLKHPRRPAFGDGVGAYACRHIVVQVFNLVRVKDGVEGRVRRLVAATIGNPECAGGSANHNLLAFAQAQLKGDLGALIEAHIEKDLGATINSPNIVYAMDTINVLFSPSLFRFNTTFLSTDTIPISFTPFRGKDMGAFIFGELASTDLPAELTVVFLQPRVTPNLNRILAADLRAVDVQERPFRPSRRVDHNGRPVEASRANIL